MAASQKAIDNANRLRYIRALERFHKGMISYLMNTEELTHKGFNKKVENSLKLLNRIEEIDLYKGELKDLQNLVKKMIGYKDSEEDIENLIKTHREAPHFRTLQKALAEDITTRVHSEEAYTAAIEASQILFGKGTTEMLKKMDEKMLLSVFKGVPQSKVSRAEFKEGIGLFDFLAGKTGVFKSNGEARRMLKDGGVSINKQKISESYQISEKDLLNDKYILVQKGKKNYFLVTVE